MSHRDSQSCVVRLNSDFLKVALRWLLKEIDWSGIALRKDCTWTPALLATTALLWAWSDELTLVDRFRTARRIVLHVYCPKVLAGSSQAFTKILRRWTEELISLLQTELRERMQRELADCWLVLGFAMFGVDGSRIELPRTRSHEQAYSSSRKRRKARKGRRRKSDRKKANSPQLWLTTMWHVGSGLPWDWRIGPADSSERAHLLAMLSTLPPGALIAADAGFVGYEYVRAIVDSGRQILLRGGSNVRLLKNLGCVRERGSTVYLWPDSEAKRRQPPLALRLMAAHNGKHPVYLVTSVLSTENLTDRQVVQLYARRWGIEVFYRHLKQTFQRRKLRSTRAENALVELQWSLAGLWAMALYALIQFQQEQLPPRRLSVAKTLRIFRRLLRDYRHPTERGNDLKRQLCTALIDDYKRQNKASRDYPRKKQETPPGPPRITKASRTQIERAQSLQQNKPKKRLTA
jgi:Transposase DDE domain